MASSTFVTKERKYSDAGYQNLQQQLQSMQRSCNDAYELIKILVRLFHDSPLPLQPLVSILNLTNINKFKDFFAIDDQLRTIALHNLARSVAYHYFRDNDMDRAEIRSLLNKIIESLIALYQVQISEELLSHSQHLLTHCQHLIDEKLYQSLKDSYISVRPSQLPVVAMPETTPIAEVVEQIPAAVVPALESVAEETKEPTQPSQIIMRRPRKKEASNFWSGVAMGAAAGALFTMFFMREENRNAVDQVTNLISRKLSS